MELADRGTPFGLCSKTTLLSGDTEYQSSCGYKSCAGLLQNKGRVLNTSFGRLNKTLKQWDLFCIYDNVQNIQNPT